MKIILTHQIQFKKIGNQILVAQDNHDNDIKVLEQDLLASAIPQISLLDLMSLSTTFPSSALRQRKTHLETFHGRVTETIKV